MRYLLGFLLVIIGLFWATVESAVQFWAGSTWNLVPLLGLLIGFYGSVLVCTALWRHRKNIRSFGYLMGNLLIMADEAKRTGRGDEFWERLTLPPGEFRRRMQESRR